MVSEHTQKCEIWIRHLESGTQSTPSRLVSIIHQKKSSRAVEIQLTCRPRCASIKSFGVESAVWPEHELLLWVPGPSVRNYLIRTGTRTNKHTHSQGISKQHWPNISKMRPYLTI